MTPLQTSTGVLPGTDRDGRRSGGWSGVFQAPTGNGVFHAPTLKTTDNRETISPVQS